jgi:hypothetical protein
LYHSRPHIQNGTCLFAWTTRIKPVSGAMAMFS